MVYYEKKGGMSMKPMTILIIEDDVNECNNFIKTIKNREDIELVKMTDSDIQGLKYVKTLRPEGIVLDIELNNSTSGNSNSLGFMDNLKKLNLNYQPIVIVTTHIYSKRTYDKLHKSGVDLILYKNHPKYSCEQVLNNFISLREIEPNKTVEVLEEELKDEESKISDYINEELEKIGVTSKLKGRKYAHDAILYLIQNDEKDVNPIKYLTKIYNKPETTISNGIQNAIIHAWKYNALEDLLENYKAVINPDRGMPTAMEFVYYYAGKVKRML